MDKFEQYLQEIVASIVLDKQRQKDLIEDFNLIRQYLLDILTNVNPDFKHILIKPSTAGIKNPIDNYFDVFIVFDLSKHMKIKSFFDRKRPGFLNIKLLRNASSKTQENPFVKLFVESLEFVNREKVTRTVRDCMELGLAEYGCYMRGHKDEIYVLELSHCTKRDAIILSAFSENEKLTIEFKILITEENKMRTIQPMPRNYKKTNWFASVECIDNIGGPQTLWRNRVFSISTPHIDFKVAQNILLCIAHRLLRHLLPDLSELFIRSALFEEILYQHVRNEDPISKLLLTDVLILVLQRLERYFHRKMFPFYFNTNLNLLSNLNHFAIIAICSKIESMLRKLNSMRNDENIEFEAVEQFFGVRVNVNLIKVDSFGAFNSF